MQAGAAHTAPDVPSPAATQAVPAAAPAPNRVRQPAPEKERRATLRDYLDVIRRRKWIALVAVLIVPATATIFSLQQQPKYRAHAQVLLSRQNLANALTGTVDPSVYLEADRVAQTQADLARVPDVARRTLDAAGVALSPLELLQESTVTTEQNADLLDFAVTDPDPARAVRLATNYAKAFVSYRQELDTASLQRAREDVQRKIKDLGTTSGSLYQGLVEKDEQLATMEALQTSNASLVEPAGRAVKVEPRPLRNGVLGIVLGLMLGVGLAFLIEAFDTRVRGAQEISEQLGLPVLARLPEPSRRLRREDELVMLADSGSPGAEAFRMLRTNLEFVRLNNRAKTIMVTSAVEREGKSTTIANLAVALAHAGQRVILVDVDLRRPYVHNFFSLGDHPGLTQVALGHASLREALAEVPTLIGDSASTPSRNCSTGSLRVLRAGPVPPNPGEFTESQTFEAVLGCLRESADIVLLDAPPALMVGDALALSKHVDAILVVTRAEVVRRHMLTELRRVLDASPAWPLGFVLTAAGGEETYGYGGSYSTTASSEPAARAAR
jgi:receptor protein-tyrosine kinase